ncbi:unnamed protein product [Cochlearia groenlandica]
MSIQFNMTNVQQIGQEGFVWGISNSDDSGANRKSIEKQSPSSPPFPLLETDEKQSFLLLETDEKQPPLSQPIHLLKTDEKVAKGRKRTKRNDKNHAEESSDHEMHIWTERERRKKMRDMFGKLHALLPQLPPKADKSTIVDEAISTIKTLEQNLHKLQMKKLEKKLHYNTSSSNTTLAYDPSLSSSSPTNLLTPISNNNQLTLPVADSSYSREGFLADKLSFSSKNLPYPCSDPIAAFDIWTSPNVVLNIFGNGAIFNLCCPKDKTGVFTYVCYLFDKYGIDVLYANVLSNVFKSTYMIQAQANPSCENQLMGEGLRIGEVFKQVAQELILYILS